MDSKKFNMIAKRIVIGTVGVKAFYDASNKTVFCAKLLGISDGINGNGKCLIENELIDEYMKFDFPQGSHRMLYKVKDSVFAYFEFFNVDEEEADAIIGKNNFIRVGNYDDIFKFGEF